MSRSDLLLAAIKRALERQAGFIDSQGDLVESVTVTVKLNQTSGNPRKVLVTYQLSEQT